MISVKFAMDINGWPRYISNGVETVPAELGARTLHTDDRRTGDNIYRTSLKTMYNVTESGVCVCV